MTNHSDNTFFQTYFEYVGDTESPLVYHRWAITTAVSSLLQRNTYFPLGHFTLYPNLYTLLVGSAGARKSSAISISRKLLAGTGFDRFAPSKCSKEQFVACMTEQSDPVDVNGNPIPIEDLLDMSIDPRHDLLIAADEFPDFIGQGNTEFTTMLTTLWDGLDKYTHPKLNSADVIVSDPNVNILGGATPDGFGMAFPPEVIGQGFTSRLLFIFSDPSGRKIPWPKKPDPKLKQELIEYLKAIESEVRGEMTVTEDAKFALEECYKGFAPLEDTRFSHYSTRRFSMLLKVSTVLAAMDLSTTIELRHALQANTMLHYAECRMSNALGEYGRSKNSGQQALVLKLLEDANRPLPIQEIWKHAHTDITRQGELVDILKNLALADKVKTVMTDSGPAFTRMHRVRKVWDERFILPDFLELEEMS